MALDDTAEVATLSAWQYKGLGQGDMEDMDDRRGGLLCCLTVSNEIDDHSQAQSVRWRTSPRSIYTDGGLILSPWGCLASIVNSDKGAMRSQCRFPARNVEFEV